MSTAKRTSGPDKRRPVSNIQLNPGQKQGNISLGKPSDNRKKETANTVFSGVKKETGTANTATAGPGKTTGTGGSTGGSTGSSTGGGTSYRPTGKKSHVKGLLLIALVLVLLFRLSHCGAEDEPEAPDEPEVPEVQVQSEEPMGPPQPPVPYVEDRYLYGMEYLRDGGVYWSDEDAVANTGDTYDNRMWPKDAYRELVFHLNKQYDTFSGVWYICKENKNDMNRNRMELYADDQLVYSSPALTAGDLPVDIEVDITDCNVLTILFCEGTGAGELGNARVWNKTPRPQSEEVHDPGKLPIWLTELDVLTVSDVAASNGESNFNTGDSVSHTLLGGHEGEIMYYLRGEYSRLTGMWGIDDGGKAKCRAKIYADKELIYETGDLEDGELPKEFDLNIEGCEKLRFEFEGINTTSDHYALHTMFANLRLHP